MTGLKEGKAGLQSQRRVAAYLPRMDGKDKNEKPAEGLTELQAEARSAEALELQLAGSIEKQRHPGSIEKQWTGKTSKVVEPREEQAYGNDPDIWISFSLVSLFLLMFSFFLTPPLSLLLSCITKEREGAQLATGQAQEGTGRYVCCLLLAKGP